jgi:formylglycine-generating enzyme required for sulfatase activity
MNEGFSSCVSVLACAMVLGGCRGSAEPESGEARQAEAAPATGAEAPDEGSVAAAAQAPVSDYIPTVIQPDPSWPTPPAGMIYIPTADVWLGADDDALNPRRLVHVEGFFIDRTEVTTASFEGCVGSGRCSPHVRPATLPLALEPDDPVARWLVEQCNFGLADRRDHPMNCVTGTEAAAYCAAQGGRLPHAQEWEYAARGTDERRFVWGNESTEENVHGNSCDRSLRLVYRSMGAYQQMQYRFEPFNDGFAGTAPVGSFPRDTSPFGLQDTAGNVSEWTPDTRDVWDYDESRLTDETIFTGGDWMACTVEVTHISHNHESEQHPTRGFRCVHDVSAPSENTARPAGAAR